MGYPYVIELFSLGEDETHKFVRCSEGDVKLHDLITESNGRIFMVMAMDCRMMDVEEVLEPGCLVETIK